MAGITLTQAESALAGWLAADEALQSGQSVRHESGRMLTRADAAEVRANIDYWDKKCQSIGAQASAGGRGRSRVVSPGW